MSADQPSPQLLHYPADLLDKLDLCLTQLNAWLPEPNKPVDFASAQTATWIADDRGASLVEVTSEADITLAALLHIDRAKQKLLQNTAAFTAGRPANHALLWGPKGTGKSSLVRALLHHFAKQGLRGIDISVDDLQYLRQLLNILRLPSNQNYRFILFIDDLSFESTDSHYKKLKTLIDGSAQQLPNNVIIYATSNRRHILKELTCDNAETQVVYRDGEPELHYGDGVEETISLSERFGLWLSFHPINQSEYLDMVAYWMTQLTPETTMTDTLRQQALQWSLERGSRSGRVAKQFVIHLTTELHYTDHYQF